MKLNPTFIPSALIGFTLLLGSPSGLMAYGGGNNKGHQNHNEQGWRGHEHHKRHHCKGHHGEKCHHRHRCDKEGNCEKQGETPPDTTPNDQDNTPDAGNQAPSS